MNRYVFLILFLLLPVVFSSATVADEKGGVIDLESVGYLQIQSSVEGARVYFDRIFMGFIQNGALTIPIDVNVNPQYSNLILEYTGYRTYTGPLPSPVPGKTVGVSVNLNQIGYDRFGIIQFESGISGAELFLNGESRGVTPDSGILRIETVPGGLYEFMVRRPGNLTFMTQQYVSSNAITVYRVKLEPALTGDVHINTTPEGAGIYLDNRYEGISPLSISNVTIGKKAIRITREGYQDWNGDLIVTGEGSGQVDAVLVSIPPSPTPECPPVTPAPLPFSSLNEETSQFAGNLPLYAGIVVIIGLIGCVIILIWAMKKKKEE